MSLCLLQGITCTCTGENIEGEKYYKENCGLQQIPTDIPAEKKDVRLDRNEIIDIRAGVFSNLTQCTELWIRLNRLTKIRKGMFNGLRSLENLYLGYNRITSIEMDSFYGLTSCTSLWLNDNYISQLRPGIFDGLKSLKKLYIYENEIIDIHSGSFLNLTQCTILSLFRNNLTHLRAGIFDGLESLMELYLYDNKINNISAVEMGQFSNLMQCTILSLSQNKLTYLRVGMLDRLEFVKKLYLHDNRISDVEIGFFFKPHQMHLTEFVSK